MDVGSGRGRQEKKGRPLLQGDVRTNLGSKQVKAKFVLSEVLLGKGLWWWWCVCAFVCA